MGGLFYLKVIWIPWSRHNSLGVAKKREETRVNQALNPPLMTQTRNRRWSVPPIALVPRLSGDCHSHRRFLRKGRSLLPTYPNIPMNTRFVQPIRLKKSPNTLAITLSVSLLTFGTEITNDPEEMKVGRADAMPRLVITHRQVVALLQLIPLTPNGAALGHAMQIRRGRPANADPSLDLVR